MYDEYIARTRPALRWMILMILMILAMVMIGGITRLTESGLSMVEWNLVQDTFLPSSDEAWQEKFEAYQASPEYKLRNQGMSLGAFKKIYFWEWFHRLWARGLGIVFFLPFLYFALRRRFTLKVLVLLLVSMFFGASQSLIGWLMVKSGLQDQPFVSHYRLCLHFFFALFSLIFLVVAASEFRPERGPNPQDPAWKKLTWKTSGTLFLVLLQIMFGTFVAGLDAGKAYNRFPFMNGQFIPSGMMERAPETGPAWMNFFDHPAAVQWIHRWLGVLVFFAVLFLWWGAQKIFLTQRQKNGMNFVFLFVGLQLVFGIATLVNKVPLVLGVIHQVTACLIVISFAVTLHALNSRDFHRRPSLHIRAEEPE